MTQVLVTRPYEASQQLAEQLDALGLSPIVMPLYTFAARNPSFEMATAWPTPGARKLAVFTSPRAVRVGLWHNTKDFFNDQEFAVIGPATRAKLESLGNASHLQAPAGFTSEDLLQMPELATLPGDAVIFCAPGGRKALASGLAGMGWNVVKAMVYERVTLLPAREQIEAVSGADDLISIWTSVSALELARELLPGAVWAKILCTPALVISTRIQHHLIQLGARCVELADGPGNTDLLHSILRLVGQKDSSWSRYQALTGAKA
jgi:uroporphyrinogen-III synthase